MWSTVAASSEIRRGLVKGRTCTARPIIILLVRAAMALLSQPRQLNQLKRPLRHVGPQLGVGYELSLERARQASPSAHTIRAHSAGR